MKWYSLKTDADWDKMKEGISEMFERIQKNTFANLDAWGDGRCNWVSHVEMWAKHDIDDIINWLPLDISIK